MRPTENRFENPEVQVLLKTFMAVLCNISSDNFRSTEIVGTTNSSANTSSKFKHNLGKVPAFWLPLEGRVYVPRNGFSDTELDLRSTATSEAFRILVVA